jgi:uncharacterized protein (TIGR02145 family)
MPPPLEDGSSSSSGVGGNSSGRDFSSGSQGGQIDGNVFTDPRDGKKYKIEVAPNGTIWMSENLNYSKGGTVGYCYGESLSMPGVDVPTCNGYGRTYSYVDAMAGNSPQGVCPSGWHIPSVAEWQAIGAGNGSTAIGNRVMSSGFYILAGNYDPARGWKERGTNGFYWTSNGSSSFVNIYNSDGSFAFNTQTANVSGDYFSVRCVKDVEYGTCGGALYNVAMQFCKDNGLYNLCGGKTYNPALEECVGGVVTEKSNLVGTSGTFTDSRDLQTYKWVKIGTQVWMAQNLNYSTTGSVCYGNNATNCVTYGRLYDWATAMMVCPSGWHLPSNDEWATLINYVESNNGCSSCAGKYLLKATSGLDTYGFSALLGGLGNLSGAFGNLDNKGVWWSSTENSSSTVYSRGIDYGGTYVFQGGDSKTNVLSIRCVKN